MACIHHRLIKMKLRITNRCSMMSLVIKKLQLTISINRIKMECNTYGFKAAGNDFSKMWNLAASLNRNMKICSHSKDFITWYKNTLLQFVCLSHLGTSGTIKGHVTMLMCLDSTVRLCVRFGFSKSSLSLAAVERGTSGNTVWPKSQSCDGEAAAPPTVLYACVCAARCNVRTPGTVWSL